jgi:drug/metabolite transporter (DMT)-like permease
MSRAMAPTMATLALLGVTAVWGWTFVIVHDAIAVYGVVAFLALRFAIAGGTTTILWGRRLSLATLRVGLPVGGLLALGYLFQTWGLLHTTPTNSGLITGLFVVFAPLADRLLYRTPMHRASALAVVLSLIGMSLLTGRVPTNLAFGDLLTLGCAVAFGLHVAVLSRSAPHHDTAALTAAQMLVVGVVFLTLWPLLGELRPPPEEVWFALALTGLVASALAYFVQTAAQRHLSAVRTAVVLTTEPIFAGLFGFLLAGDRLGPVQLAGAALILAALALSEVVPRLSSVGRRRRPPGEDGDRIT